MPTDVLNFSILSGKKKNTAEKSFLLSIIGWDAWDSGTRDSQLFSGMP